MLDSPDQTIALNLPRFTERVDGREGQILAAAFHCIAEIGIAATTTRAVARRADLNQGSIHYYFASKDELLLGVLKGLMSTAVANARTVRESSLSPTEKIYCILRSGATFIQQGQEVVVSISLWAHAVSKGGIWRDSYRELFDQFRGELILIIEEGIAIGEFRGTDPRPVAETIITAVQGVGMHYMMSPADFAGESVSERLVGLFWKILGVKEA
jgi:AcrR family transcriptional regulator